MVSRVGIVRIVVADETIRTVQIDRQRILQRMVYRPVDAHYGLAAGFERIIRTAARKTPHALHQRHVIPERFLPGLGIGNQPDVRSVRIVRIDRSETDIVEVGDLFGIVVQDHVLIALISTFQRIFLTAAAVDLLDDDLTGFGSHQRDIHRLRKVAGRRDDHLIARAVEIDDRILLRHPVARADPVNSESHFEPGHIVVAGRSRINRAPVHVLQSHPRAPALPVGMTFGVHQPHGELPSRPLVRIILPVEQVVARTQHDSDHAQYDSRDIFILFHTPFPLKF